MLNAVTNPDKSANVVKVSSSMVEFGEYVYYARYAYLSCVIKIHQIYRQKIDFTRGILLRRRDQHFGTGFVFVFGFYS